MIFFLYIFPYLPNNIYTCRHQCINRLPSFHISSLSNYAYINVIYPSYCDTTVDLYIEPMNSWNPLELQDLYQFLQNFLGEDPPPFKYKFQVKY